MTRIIEWIYKVLIYFIIGSISLTILYRFIPIPFTWTMVGNQIGVFADKRWELINYRWVPYDKISPHMKLAAIASEDQMFKDHAGFDIKHMMEAYQTNLKTGQFKSGGSTISQQVAKNVFLWQHKSYFRKGLEAYFTILIELFWSKKRILEVYLNVAETGIDTYGVESGAQRYFKTSAQNLSAQQAAQLASILPKPKAYGITSRGKKVNRILRNIRQLGGQSYLKQL